MTTLLLLLLLMGLPAAVLLIAGIWAVRKKYGGVLQILGIVSIALGMLLGVVTILVVPGIATTATVSNQQKWDTLGAERSGAGWRSGELPEGPVVESSPFGGLSLHLLPAL